jgi:DNA-binding NarL/FixJ family response regulator
MIVLASGSKKIRRQWIKGLSLRSSVVEVADHSTLLQSIAAYRPSVILLDYELPELGGIHGITTLSQLFPSTYIILLSNSLDDHEIIRALKAGVRGFCHRDIDGDLLTKAVRLVRKGEIWVGRSIILALLKELSSGMSLQHTSAKAWGNLKDQLVNLTPREIQVAQMVGTGALNKQIAVGMNITERTVKAHLTSIFRKLNLSDRLQLALAVSLRNHDQLQLNADQVFLYRTKVQ